MDSSYTFHKYTWLKRAFLCLTFFIVFGLFSPFSFADDAGLQDVIGTISYWANFLYIILRPLICLGGLFLDNSLIYGEAIGFDTILWNLRNIVKNLSNFGLGFLFVYQIFTYIFSQGNDVKSKLPDQIKKCFIAGVLIQISWFLMATLIDISTIATYGVGGLPLTLEKDVIDSTKDSKKQRYTYGFFMDMDLSKADPYDLYYKTKKHYIPPCYTDPELQGITFSGNLVLTGGESPISLTGAVIDFIVGIKDNLNTGLNLPLLTGYCNLNSKVYKYSEVDGNIKDRRQEIKDNITNKTISDLSILRQGATVSQYKYNTGTEYSSIPCIYYAENTAQNCFSPDEMVDILSGENDTLFTLKSLTEEYQSYLGPFQSFFGSLISALDLTTVTAKGSTFSRFLNLSIDLIFIVLLMIPLATIAIVMAYRVFVLWMYIILLPAFILFKAFGRGDKFSFLDGKFKVETILSTIFSPVIICFALSMAVLLINTMNEVVNSGAWDFEGVHLDYIDISEWVHVGGEGLGEIIVSLVGLALAWILLFWAIKATSIGEKIGKTIDETARNFANSVPFIGLPGVDGKVSLNSMRKIDDLAKEKWGGESIFKDHNELMDERLGNFFALSDSAKSYDKTYEDRKRRASTEGLQMFNSFMSGNNLMPNNKLDLSRFNKFSDLDAKQYSFSYGGGSVNNQALSTFADKLDNIQEMKFLSELSKLKKEGHEFKNDAEAIGWISKKINDMANSISNPDNKTELEKMAHNLLKNDPVDIKVGNTDKKIQRNDSNKQFEVK